jgi:hypothetical protein
LIFGHNVQKENDKKTNSGRQYTTHKTKDLTPLKTGGEPRLSARISSLCSTSDNRYITVKRHEHHAIWKMCWTPIYINANNINIGLTP